MSAGRSVAGPLPRAAPRVAPAGGRTPAPAGGGVPPGCLLQWLPSDTFPAERELLVTAAVDGDAPGWLTDGLRHLPPGHVFQNVEQVAAALNTQCQVQVAVEGEADLLRAPARP